MSCSKQNKVAGAGTALVVVGAVLLSATFASVKTLQVASATVKGSKGASCNVGKLGLFQSAYSPECAGLPGTAFRSNTLDYWPLFPAQTSFASPLFVSSFGVGGSPFTTCGKYITEAADNSSNVPVDAASEMLTAVVPALLKEWSQQTAPAVLRSLLTHRWWSDSSGRGVSYDYYDFQNSPFELILTESETSPAYSNFTAMVRLVQDSCKGVSAVVTGAQCAELIALLYDINAVDSFFGRTFETPVGTVFANYTAYTLSALQLTWSMVAMAEQMGEGWVADDIRELASVVKLVYEISLGCSSLPEVFVSVRGCSISAQVPDMLAMDNYHYPLAPLVLRDATGAASPGSFWDFTKGVVAMLDAGTVPEQLLPVFKGIKGVAEASDRCMGLLGGQEELRQCIGTVISYGFFAGFYPGLQYNIGEAFLSQEDARNLLVQNVTTQCELNGVDQAKFATSQKLFISALSFLWLSAVTGLGAAALGSLALNIASTVGSLVGAITLVVGLFHIYTATVYSNVGAPCAEGAVCYTFGLSISLTIAAIAFSIASVIAFFVAAVFAYKAGKASQDNAMAKGAAGEAPHMAAV